MNLDDSILSGHEGAGQALAAMRQRLVELDGWTWEANYEMVARELRSHGPGRVEELEDLLQGFLWDSDQGDIPSKGMRDKARVALNQARAAPLGRG